MGGRTLSREAADVARRAAEIIQERGHSKTHYEDDEGRVCAAGAIQLAAAGDAYADLTFHSHGGRVKTELRALLCERAGRKVFSIAYWNDSPGVDEADVAKALLQVADRLDVAP